MRTVTPAARRLAALLWLITTVLVGVAWHMGAALKAESPRAQAQVPIAPAR
jgi:hypothetical protein